MVSRKAEEGRPPGQASSLANQSLHGLEAPSLRTAVPDPVAIPGTHKVGEWAHVPGSVCTGGEVRRPRGGRWTVSRASEGGPMGEGGPGHGPAGVPAWGPGPGGADFRVPLTRQWHKELERRPPGVQGGGWTGHTRP